MLQGRKVWNISHVLGLAFLLRFLFVIAGSLHGRAAFFAPDSGSYLAAARQLVTHHHFFSVADLPEISRTPGYPVMLGAGLVLHCLVPVTIGLQIFLSCLTVYLVYRVTVVVFSAKPALVAATLCAIEPLSILYASFLLSETLFTTLVTSWVYFLLEYVAARRSRYLFVSAALMAASTYVRPASYFAPYVTFMALLLWTRLQMVPLKPVILSFMLVVALVSCWQLRNWLETGFTGFSAIGDYDICLYEAAVLATKQGIPVSNMSSELGCNDEAVYLVRHAEQKSWPIGERLAQMKREALHIIEANSLVYARMHLTGVMRILFGPGTTEFLDFFGIRRNRLSLFVCAAILLLWELPYPLFAIFGLSPGKWSLFFVILAIAYYIVITGGPLGYSRFRVPVMPLISVLAGQGLYTWIAGRQVDVISPPRRPSGGS
jgi:4-amino-4-deoxy-L-arabinose transferase-like glycosyltransferase